MVRALLAGRKTQTRRLATSPLRRVEAGDRLYVREAVSCGGVFSDVVEVRYRAHERCSHTEFVEQVPVDRAISALPAWPKYRPSIHMPRWASRVALVVEASRVEPLQAITYHDAVAEGVERHDGNWQTYDASGAACLSPKESFCSLWASLHTKAGERWQDNPDVVALTFRVVAGNIDQVPA